MKANFDISAIAQLCRTYAAHRNWSINTTSLRASDIIDEAAFVDSLAELLKAALAFLMWGGQVVVCSTHNGAENPFNQTIQDILSGRAPHKHVRIDFDQALKDGLYERICLVKGDEWTAEGEAAWRQEIIDFYGEGADEELFCVPSASSGACLVSPANTANVAAQGFDIGVTAAMGMNPMMIGMQQGTQLVQVVQQMGGGKQALQGIATGFLSILNPMSLATIGIVAFGAAGIQALTSLGGETRTFDDAMADLKAWQGGCPPASLRTGIFMRAMSIAIAVAMAVGSVAVTIPTCRIRSRPIAPGA